MLGLVRLRIVTAAQLRRTWRVGIFVMTVIGVILPGVDPVTTILTVIPLVALYALSIGLATFFEPRWRAARETAPSRPSRSPYPKIELHVHLEATIAARDAARDREAERRDAPRRHGRRASRALPLPRLRPLHRGLDPDHELPADGGGLPPGGRRLRRRGEAARRGLPRGDLLPDRAHVARRRLGRDLQRLLRRRPGGEGAARRRGAPEPGHHPQRAARGRAHARRGRRPLPRPRSRRRRTRRRGGLYPNATFEPAFRAAREAGLGSVPHAGEVVGPESVRTALDLLEPDRIRHGFRAIEDPALVQELADRGVVLDVTPISNVRTGVVASLEEHPLPRARRAPASAARSRPTTR